LARVLRVAHTPDPDDAYMFYGIVAGAVRVPGWDRVEHIVEDIETLNQRIVEQGWDPEMTAASAHAYAYVSHRFYLLRAGASMGEGYGPIVVARRPLQSLRGLRVAVPGRYTTARLLLALATGGGYRETLARFDQIPGMVLRGEADAGLLIHEAQLTYHRMGLVKVLDLWEWWNRETGGLPMPLGVDLASRRLGPVEAARLREALQESIRYAWSHHEEAARYAARFSRGASPEEVSRFVKMYVNERTLDMGEEGVEAHRRLYEMAHRRGLLPRLPDIVLV
jgi:1,4-dihydroxy-6-naphthoate synthase